MYSAPASLRIHPETRSTDYRQVTWGTRETSLACLSSSKDGPTGGIPLAGLPELGECELVFTCK